MRIIKLKKKEERRVQRGHPWVFSNEVQDLPADAVPGEPVEVRDFTGNFLGRGYVNPRSLIAVRILTRKQEDMDAAFFTRRIGSARDLRKDLGFGESFRAVFSEGDGLPGLIVDKYADTLVVQSLTAGIDGMLDLVLAALRDVYGPKTIVLRNDTASRELEGLERETRVVLGETSGMVEFEESGIRYRANVIEGQKTGFFFDQRENRLALKDLVRGRRTLDCFCYVGAWALSAARYGATEVIGIDSSEKAATLARSNAELNNLSAKFLVGDVFEKLRELEKQKERFGCVILDPPAFVKSRAKVREALKGYKEINLRGMRLLEPGGFLVTCSCSHHIDQELFREMLIDAAWSAGRQARLLEMRTQSRDHPMLLAAKESQYLKCAILSVE
ncbi:MAG: class I SAM-dependent rRNA methyltransferase [Nitrospirae bacterium]|nr:class I SAM-dependent rRNA methyltransferase [Nitrospirota bacterium]NTW64740.1 class I SAM-dependent rRNA methyltransferase [Nitrospirota bacterium]